MTRIEQRGAVAFTRAGRGGDPVDYPVGVCLLENDAAVPFNQPQSFAFCRTSSRSRQRKLAVCAIVRPWAISFVRSLISASDQGSPEFASIGFTPKAQLSGGEARTHHRPRQNAPTVCATVRRCFLSRADD